MTNETGRRKRVALVTVTYNSGEVLDDFLASLDSQTSTDWILVAVDNASTDTTRSRLEAWRGPKHLVLNDRNLGFAVATNQGTAWALENGWDAVMFLNNDTAFQPDFVAGLLAFQESSDAPIVAPVVVYASDPQRNWFADGGFTWMRGGFQAWMGETPRAGDSWISDFAPGCALLIARRVFDAVGLLDERFFVYWEDVDFCLRCRQHGIPVTILARPTIAHKVSALTGGSSPFSIGMYHHNQILLMQKHFGRAATWLLAPGMVLKILGRRILGRDRASETALRLRTVAAALVGSQPA